MKSTLAVILLFSSTVAVGQNSRYDSMALGPKGPIPGAKVAVCSQPANTNAQPCSPLAALCASLTDATCAQPNPLTADSLGNYHFYSKQSQGPFTIQIYGPQVASPLILPDQSFGVGATTAAFTNPGVFTNTQMNEYLTSLLNGINLTTENATQGGTFATDAIVGGIAVPVGATQVGNAAVAGYANTSADSAGRTKGNTAGFYGQCRNLANNSACWGINTVTQDAVGLTGHNFQGYELDMNLYGSPTYMRGMVITGLNGGGTVPAGTAAFEIVTPYKWPLGWICDRASCNVGLQLNDQLSTNPSPSQSIQMISHTGAGTPLIAQINGDASGNVVITPGAGFGTANITQGGLIVTSATSKLLTNVTGITATTPGTAEFTWPALTPNVDYSFHCAIMYQQATAASGVGFSVQGAVNAPTRLDAMGTVYTNNTGTSVQGSAANVTTTTATSVVTATPSATATTFQVTLDGTIQVGAITSTLTVLAYTGNAGDAVSLMAGSYCSIFN